MFAVACGSLNFFRRWPTSDDALFLLALALRSASQILSDVSNGVIIDLDEDILFSSSDGILHQSLIEFLILFHLLI